MEPSIRVFDDAAALARGAAELVVSQAIAAINARGRFALALSGGSTPKRLYELLASDPALKQRMPWAQTHFFWGDERTVPPDHPDSNYRMTDEAMLRLAGVRSGNIHRIRGESPDPSAAAAEYEAELRTFFALGPGALPRFDLVLLGMGADSHTASLFPQTVALGETSRLVVANTVAKLNTVRVTLTAPVFNHAATVAFLVSGEDKREALEAVIRGPRDPQQRPAQLIMPVAGTLLWLVDRAASATVSSA